MVARLLIAAFLLAHASVHGAFLAPRPPVTAGGPAWPFELGQSWILGPIGIDPELGRMLGMALVVATFCGFALAALAAAGVAPAGIWPAAVAIGAVASIGLLALFFQPMLVLGVGIDLLLVWAVLIAQWAPEGVTP
jgi:hypothetical protein